ncbi:HD-GYP domain-containing protein [Paenibacillus taihuensis]|uniref:HD-GYP domain-containing protein n=1 Tax=Paenibacillus taihuensis TaxID=1156355 RepID=UPI003CCC5F04
MRICWITVVSLRGEDISLAGRIVAVADCFDAMTSHRVYRNAKDKQEAAEEILKNAGKQFDPHIAKMFVDFPLSGEPLLPVPTQLHYINLPKKQSPLSHRERPFFSYFTSISFPSSANYCRWFNMGTHFSYFPG